eukprot:gene22491-29125_t
MKSNHLNNNLHLQDSNSLEISPDSEDYYKLPTTHLLESGNTSFNSSISGTTSPSISKNDDADCYDLESDNYGWFDVYPECEETSAQNIRQAWTKLVNNISPPTSLSHLSSFGNEEAMNELYDDVEQPIAILYSWNNNNPSVSLKLSSDDVSSTRYGINISSCVSGLRICQYSCGVIRAEFNYIFCYGSRSYSSWKPYGEFKQLADILKKLDHKKKANFSESLKQFKFLEEKKRWFRSLDILYLIEKSIYLGRFMEALLLESTSPGIMLAFVQNP